VSYAADAGDGGDSVGGMIARGPGAALTRNQHGKVVPQPQADAVASELAAHFADTLNKGAEMGYLGVSETFAVTITPEGSAFAAQAVEDATAGCDKVKSVTADWTGFQLELESTCTIEEWAERMDVDLEQIEAGAGPPIVTAAGFAPSAPNAPAGDAISSEWWGCIGAFAAFGFSLLGVGLAVVSPATSWLTFWLIWSVAGVSFFTAGTTLAQNCTQAVSAKAKKQVWVGYEAPSLPLATVGLGSFRIQDIFSPPAGNEAWVNVWNYCQFSYYSNYRWSSYGYSVPLYKRYNCY
jgi:hypothetical protein